MPIGLKPMVWERSDDVLAIVCDPSRRIELADPDGSVEALLDALAAHPRSVADLRRMLSDRGTEVDGPELADAVATLDSLRLLADPDAPALQPPQLNERYFSNLAFFELFATLDVSHYELQRRLRRAHVLQLGVGGLGSNVLQCMAGLGVGRLTLVDDDRVEPRNFVRQWPYRQCDIGRPKVLRAAQWVREFDDTIEVCAVARRVSGPDDITDLLEGVDLVVSGIDQPDGVDLWVNEACASQAVPWVRGGMVGSELVYFSIDPGHSPCLACRVTALALDHDAPLGLRQRRVNRGVGPAAALVGSLVALEAMRYLTGFEPPAAAGAQVYVPVRAGGEQRRETWPPDPDCAACRAAALRLGSGALLP